ncbi:MAG: type II 3-dehydroquinate dehydratase [Lachnospirales bacterium]
MKIAIVNGPNLNMLGKRDKEHYGEASYEDLCNNLKETYYDVDLIFFQSNYEGELIDFIQQCDFNNFDGIVINPAALSHYSYALADCVCDVKVPCVEVHISNIFAREDFRKTSLIAPHCIGSITGFGFFSYNLGLLSIMRHISTKN